MPNYIYKAKSQMGQTISGVEFFEDEHKLAESLRAKGLSLISAVAASSVKHKKITFTFGRVSLVDRLMFTRNLRVMLGVGMSIGRIMDILAEQARSRKFANVIKEIGNRIRSGTNLGEAFTGWPAIFDDFYINMIKAGESGSNLESTLLAIEDKLRRDAELKSKIKSALIYPIIILTALAGVGGMIIFFVMPRLAKAFAGMNVKMPFTLKIFISLNKFLSHYPLIVILISAALLFFLIFFWKFPRWQKIRSEIILKMPIFGNISRQLNSARFLRTFSSLIKGGVPVSSALSISADTLSNYFFKQAVKEASSNVQRGLLIHQSLERDFWPSLVIEMMVVGEEAGRLEEVTDELASFYEEEVANIVKNLASLIEPILMIVIGIAVAVFAVSVIIPIYSIVGNF